MVLTVFSHLKQSLVIIERWFVLAMVALFPVLMGTVNSAASVIFILLCLVGLFIVFQDWKRLLQWEKWLLWGFMGFVLYNLASIGWADDSSFAWRRFEKIGRFLLAVPLYLLVRRHADVAYKALLYGLIVAGPVMLWSAMTTLISGRSQGAYNHILFGDFTLMVCLSALSAALLARRNLWVTLLLLASAMLALYASLLSQTRGAWLVLPVSVLLFLWISLKRYEGRVRWMVIGSVLVLALGAGITLSQTEIFQKRLHQAVDSWDAYWRGEYKGNVASRFRKWEAAVEHWKEDPVFGSGLGDYWHDTKLLAEKEPYFKPIAQYSEAHNLYFEFLATSGLVGLAILLWAIFWQPFIVFWRHVGDRANPVVQYLAFDGVLIIVAVMSDGISQNWLSRNSLTSAYIFFIVVFLTGIARLASAEQREREVRV